MKTKHLLTPLLFLLTLFASAQKDKFTQSVTKITMIEPGIAHEFSLGNSTTFFLRGGLTATLASDYYEEITAVLFRPFASASFRTYYNFQKRELMEKNIERNSANYVAILLMAATKPLNEGKDYNLNYNNPMINTGVVWGMQRNYSSRFSLDLNIGLGYVKTGDVSGFAPIGEINIGFWLGKR